MNQLPMYKDSLYVNEYDNSRNIHDNCMTIPCSTNISDRELETVVTLIKNF